MQDYRGMSTPRPPETPTPTLNRPQPRTAEQEAGAAAPRLRGFAAMTPERRREIASAGGKAAQALGSGHRFNAAEARVAGAKGGATVSQDRQHMAEVGRKGGVSVSQDRDHMAAIGRVGGAAVAADRAHMAEIGRRGGRSRSDSRGGGSS
jgi:general stress protein YciG